MSRRPAPTRPRRGALAALLLVPALALSGCGGTPGSGTTASTAGAVTASGPASAQTATVVAGKDLTFAPETVRATVGTLALTMRVTGGVPHDLAFDDPSVGAPLPVTPDGPVTQTYTFSKPGTYRFVCTIHSGMVGQVVVTP